MYDGAYAKAPQSTGPEMATIKEKETKKRRTDPQGSKMKDVANHEATLAKLMGRIESAKQKADNTSISEIPSDLRLKKYTEEMKEEGAQKKKRSLRTNRKAER